MTKKVDLLAQMKANAERAKQADLAEVVRQSKVAKAMAHADEYLDALGAAGDPVAIAAAAACIKAGGAVEASISAMVAHGVCDAETAAAALDNAATATVFTLDERLADAAALPRDDRELALRCAIAVANPKTADDMGMMELIAAPLGLSAMRYL